MIYINYKGVYLSRYVVCISLITLLYIGYIIYYYMCFLYLLPEVKFKLIRLSKTLESNWEITINSLHKARQDLEANEAGPQWHFNNNLQKKQGACIKYWWGTQQRTCFMWVLFLGNGGVWLMFQLLSMFQRFFLFLASSRCICFVILKSRERVNLSHESLRTSNKKWLCWRRAVAVCLTDLAIGMSFRLGSTNNKKFWSIYNCT